MSYVEQAAVPMWNPMDSAFGDRSGSELNLPGKGTGSGSAKMAMATSLGTVRLVCPTTRHLSILAAVM